MNTEKKKNLVKMRGYKKVMAQNKRINKINFIVLAAGLLLILVGQGEIGNYVLWAGLFVFFSTAVSGILASSSFRRQK